MSGGLLEWRDVERLVSLLCKMKEPDADACEYLLERALKKIEREKGQIAVSCIDAEAHFDDERREVVIEIDTVADIPDAAEQIRKLGEPIQVRFLSFEKDDASAWDEKYAFLYIVEQRKVWFEFEKYGTEEKLVRAVIGFR